MPHDQNRPESYVRNSTYAALWTRLRCSRCRYSVEHPGPVTLGDLDRARGLCGAMLGAVTVFRVSELREV
jgi:hypothetical protein